MRKTLKNVIVEKQQEAVDTVTQKQERLEEIVGVCVTLDKQGKDITKRVKEYKDEIKQLFQDLNILEYTASNGNRVSMTVVDKTSIDEFALMNYLKEKGLTQFIHTKEYIDENEIAYAVAQGNINAADLAPMQVPKTEYRLNMK